MIRDRLRKRTDALRDQLRIVNERLVVSSNRVQELAESETRHRAELNALLEGLGEGIIIVDATGRVRMINEAACAILGAGSVPLADMLDVLKPHDLHARSFAASNAPSVALCVAKTWRTRGGLPSRQWPAAPSRDDGHERERRGRRRGRGDCRLARRHGTTTTRAATRGVHGA